MREDWVAVPLSTVADVISGKNQKGVVNPDGQYPIYGSGGMFGRSDDYICEPGTTVIGRKGTIDNPIYVNQKFWNVDTAFGICPLTTSLESKYLYFFCKSYDFKKLDKSTTIPSLAKRDILKINFPLPPLPEQRAIVAKIEQLFSDLDNGIANLKEAKEKLSIYRQALLKKAFEGELTEEWRSQQTDLPTGDELLQQIKEERQRHYDQQLTEWKQVVKEWEKKGKEGKKPGKPSKPVVLPLLTKENADQLSPLPAIWVYNYLAYAGLMGRGKSKHRPRNDNILFGGNYPFLQTGEVKSQRIVTEFSKTYNEIGLGQSKLWPKGTLCITIAANIAETAFLGIDACFPDSVVGFTPFERIINSRYIEYFFRLAKSKISAYAPATAQKNINLTTLENLVIPYCSIQEQNQIVQEIESRLSVCDKLEESIDNSLKQSEALRQSILKRAFEGKLLTEAELTACRQETDWEPAEKLLERIKREN